MYLGGRKPITAHAKQKLLADQHAPRSEVPISEGNGKADTSVPAKAFFWRLRGATVGVPSPQLEK
jgi:hypothetical protein